LYFGVDPNPDVDLGSLFQLYISRYGKRTPLCFSATLKLPWRRFALSTEHMISVHVLKQLVCGYCIEQEEVRLTVDELPVLAMLVAATYESSSSSLANTSTLNGECGTGSPDQVTSTVYSPGSVTL